MSSMSLSSNKKATPRKTNFMKIITYTCDIKGCKSNAHEKPYKMQVIFTTETTEGKSCDPYLDFEKIYLCGTCRQRVISERRYIMADGAQGFNNYHL